MPTYDNLPSPSKHFKGKWYRKLVEDLQLAGMAKRTVYGYVRAVRNLAEFSQKSPEKLSESDVRVFLLHEIVEKQSAAGTQSVLLSASSSSIGPPAHDLGKCSLKPSLTMAARCRRSSLRRRSLS